MTTQDDWTRINKELRAESEESDRLFKERIEKLRDRKPEELPPLLAHWKQQIKDTRGVDAGSTKTRQLAELWVKAISFLLENPNVMGATPVVANSISSLSAPAQGTSTGTASTTGTSFKRFSEDYLTYVKNNFSKGTLANAERVMMWFTEMFGDSDLGSFTLENLEQFKSKRKESGVSNTTINIDIRTMKAALQVAKEWKRIAENPFENAKQLKVDQKSKKILSADDFTKIIKAIKENWLRDIISFNVLTGLRLGEIMNLKWSDYDSSKQKITIQSSEGYRVKGGKMRPVSIGPDGVEILNSRPRIGEWIFAGDKGKKYTDDYVSRKFKEYVRSVGLPEEIHYHRLRDTYCTWMAEKNVPIHIIKALAGHSSVRITEGYITANVDAMKDAAGKIGLPVKNKKNEGEKGEADAKNKP